MALFAWSRVARNPWVERRWEKTKGRVREVRFVNGIGLLTNPQFVFGPSLDAIPILISRLIFKCIGIDGNIQWDWLLEINDNLEMEYSFNTPTPMMTIILIFPPFHIRSKVSLLIVVKYSVNTESFRIRLRVETKLKMPTSVVYSQNGIRHWANHIAFIACKTSKMIALRYCVLIFTDDE